jgi:ferredoxin
MLPQNNAVIDATGLQSLVDALLRRGYRVIAPTIRQDAIVYDEIQGIDELPKGWTDEQDGGTYRLRRRDDDAMFGYAVGPHSWKKFLFPPRTLLWEAQRTQDGFEVDAPEPDGAPLAFLGVRGCELAAIRVQDRVFLDGYPDPTYEARRKDAFIIAVNCSTPAGTCFCTSMGTGPQAGPGYDLALTEVVQPGNHIFVVDGGSDRGREILEDVPHRAASSGEGAAAKAVVDDAAGRMGRTMETDGIKNLLYSNYEHSRWDDVAERCLACGNCTMVCPTCFCSTVEDTTDLTNDRSERHRVWDSCFTLEFSELGGHNVRGTTRSRYRQWMTHKLATWIDQFGTSGCVGCGRCITWCPVGIDITEEVAAIRQSQRGADDAST